MGYELQAVIGAAEALRRVPEEFRAAQVVELQQGLAMVPMTEALLDEATDGTQDAAFGFWFLRSVGVQCGAGVDEFASVGLRRHRTTEDWASSYLLGYRPDPS